MIMGSELPFWGRNPSDKYQVGIAQMMINEMFRLSDRAMPTRQFTRFLSLLGLTNGSDEGFQSPFYGGFIIITNAAGYGLINHGSDIGTG